MNISFIMVDNNEKIYVETDYDNIVLIDPNKVVDSNGGIQERAVRQENMVIYANLEAIIIPRTRNNISLSNENEDNLMTIATNNFSNVNFMNPNSGYFTTEWADEITGKDTLKGKGKNQIRQNITENSEFKIKQTIENRSNSETLGIETIVVTNNMAQTPNVTIDLIDVQGRTLFEQGENSPYASFFNLPYPTFYLTLKGYYGKAIRYQLMLQKFTSELDSSTGNFRVRLSFYSYKYMILADLQVGLLSALPNMYSTKYELSYSKDTPDGESNKDVKNISVTRGYQKIKEVYGEYKRKKLIPENLPELSIPQFIVKLENFEKNILSSLDEENFFPFTDIRNFRTALNEFKESIFSEKEDSWSKKYLNIDDYLIEKTDENKLYRFKKEVNETIEKREEAENEYNRILNEFLAKWRVNSTFGPDGTFSIGGLEKRSGVQVDFNYFKVAKDLDLVDVDWCLTQKRRYGNIENGDCRGNIETKYGLKILSQIHDNFHRPVEEKMFVFTGKNSFIDEYIKLEKQINDTDELIEGEIKKNIEKKFESVEFMGFKPTIRNIFSIIFASIEGVFRLLDEVHEKAFKERYNRVRQTSILGNGKDEMGIDGKGENNGNINDAQIYPWPEFFVKTEDEKTTSFNLRYPGDPEIISITQGNNYEIWPEIEFVEETIRAITDKDVTFNSSDFLLNSGKNVKRLSINASEFPINNTSYGTKNFISFFYEIKERIELISSLDRLNRLSNITEDISDYLFEYEKYGISKSLEKDNFDLINVLKTINISDTLNFESLLKQISNEGNGEKWQLFIRGTTTTDYLKPILDEGKDFGIINYKTFESPEVTIKNYELIDNVIKNSSNILDIFDTYPISDFNWIKANVSNGANLNSIIDFIDIKKIIGINKEFSQITNFNELDHAKSKRPFTTFNFLKLEEIRKFDSSNEIENFYIERINENTLLPTEGLVLNKEEEILKTVSIFNTSFFINAITLSVEKIKNKSPYPFTEAAYLFLNSLPLATLREQFISLNDGSEEKNGFILPSLKMFSAVHRLPYPWILKYGSIWNRYKTFVKTGVDNMVPVWRKTDHNFNFDPLTSSPTINYSLNIGGDQYSIIKEINTINATGLNVGFFPKLMNDIFYLFAGKDLLTGYTSSEIQEKLNNDEISLNLTEIKNKTEGVDPNNENRIISMKFWTSFLKTNNSVSFEEEERNKLIITPSFGSLTNETELRCFDAAGSLIEEVAGNDGIFDGSCRLFWSAPNYGFFKAEDIVMPSPNEYIKEIKTNTEQQTSFSFNSDYSSVEELITTFKSEILDQFEQEFLNFSKISYDMNGEGNSYKENFHLLLKKLLLVDANGINDVNYLEEIWMRQGQNFKDIIGNFLLNNDKYFKYGNVSNFNKRIFNSFTSKTIVDPLVTGEYKKNSLMPQIPFQESFVNNNNAWVAMLLNVGNFTSGILSYTDEANPFTDFFIDNNVDFTEANVKTLYPLIQIYGNRKLQNQGNYNSDKFKDELYSFVVNNIDNLENRILNKLITKLQGELPDVDRITKKIESAVEGNQGKLDLWEYFKVFNDRWIAGNRFTNKLLFEDVLFLDRASRDLGDLVYVDIFKLKDTIRAMSNGKGRVIDLISQILSQNKFIMMPLPAFVNFYGVKNGGEENPLIENSSKSANDLFGTFLNVDYRDSTPKLVCFYTDIPSKHLDLKKNKDYLFRTDAFDIGSSKPNPNRESLLKKTDWSRSNKCVGFNVDFGTRNQNMFKNLSLNQESKTNTSETFMVHEAMAQGAANRSVGQESVSLWEEYRSRSYTCSVFALGNALIQPTMYFNLRHVPMFSGPYLIMNVEHTISSGDFITKFTGVRVPVYSLPVINNSLASLNVNLFKDSISKIRKRYQGADFNKEVDKNSINLKNRIYFSYADEKMFISEGCLLNDNENNLYSSFIPAQDVVMDVLSISDLIEVIKKVIPNNNDESIKNRAMLFHLIYMEGASRGEIISWNKNLGGIAMKDKTGKINNYPIIMNNVKKEYICLKDGFNITLPYFVFETYEDSIKSLHLLIKNTFTNIDASNIITDSFDENTLTTSLFRNWLRNWIIKEEFDLTDLTNNNKEKINELKLKTGRSVNIMKAKDLLI